MTTGKKQHHLGDPRNFDPKKIPQKNFEMVQNEFKQKQLTAQQQQQEQQKAIQTKISTMMANDMTDILNVVDMETFNKIKEFVRPVFAWKTSLDFKVSPANFLELYERIYEREELVFNLVEVGILSDMVYSAFTYPEISDSDIHEVLKTRAIAFPIFQHYNKKQMAIIQFAQLEVQQSIEVVKSPIIS